MKPKKSYCLYGNCCCCVVMNEFQAFAAPLLNSVTESIVRFKVLKFSAAAFIALTLIWLLIRSALTMLSVISFDRFTSYTPICFLYTKMALALTSYKSLATSLVKSGKYSVFCHSTCMDWILKTTPFRLVNPN